MIQLEQLAARYPGKNPVASSGGRWLQPAVRAALQIAPSITDTVLSSPFSTNTLWVTGSTTTPIGTLPTVTVGADWPQPAVTAALQVEPLMT